MSKPIVQDLKGFFDNLTSLGFQLNQETIKKIIKKAEDGSRIQSHSNSLFVDNKTGLVSAAGVELKFEFTINPDGTFGWGQSRLEARTIKNPQYRDFDSFEQLITRIKRADKTHSNRMNEILEADQMARKEMEEVAQPYIKEFGKESVVIESLPRGGVYADIKHHGLEATIFRSLSVSTPEQHKTLTPKQLKAHLNAHNAITNNSPMASAIKLLSEKLDAYQAELDVVKHCDPQRAAVLEKEIPELETALGLLF